MSAHKVELLEFVEVGAADACWPWTGVLSASGYGRLGKRGYPHRAMYERTVGSIPHGMELDHTCHTADTSCPGGIACPHRRCVNPAHLAPVTHVENTMRGRSFAARNASKTECANGHGFTPDNTLTRSSDGARVCRRCSRASVKRYRERAVA